MTFLLPALIPVAALATASLVVAYVLLQRRRTAALAAAGLTGVGQRGLQVGWSLLIVGTGVLLFSLSRPEATVALPRVSGTVMVVLDVSASMTADDVKPSRLEVAKKASERFVDSLPSSVDVGVVAFSSGALTVQQPDADHAAATTAISRLSASGGTSVGQAILGSLSSITGKTVTLGDDGSATKDLGYWRSATIVVFSDGQETGESDPTSAALVAATAGVRIETVGVGTAAGTTVDVDGYHVQTALDDKTLKSLSSATGGTYRAVEDADDIDAKPVDLRRTLKPRHVELTGFGAGIAALLLAAGSAMVVRRTGGLI